MVFDTGSKPSEDGKVSGFQMFNLFHSIGQFEWPIYAQSTSSLVSTEILLQAENPFAKDKILRSV